MRKSIDILIIILLFVINYYLQVNFFTWFKIAGIMPNLFILFVMMIGLFLKKEYGVFFGIVFGLLLDFFIGERIGIYAIAYGIIGLIAGLLEKNISKESRITIILITVILTGIFELITYGLSVVFFGMLKVQVLEFLKIVGIEMLYNAILIIILYPCFRKFGNRLEDDFEQDNNFLNFL